MSSGGHRFFFEISFKNAKEGTWSNSKEIAAIITHAILCRVGRKAGLYFI